MASLAPYRRRGGRRWRPWWRCGWRAWWWRVCACVCMRVCVFRASPRSSVPSRHAYQRLRSSPSRKDAIGDGLLRAPSTHRDSRGVVRREQARALAGEGRPRAEYAGLGHNLRRVGWIGGIDGWCLGVKSNGARLNSPLLASTQASPRARRISKRRVVKIARRSRLAICALRPAIDSRLAAGDARRASRPAAFRSAP